MAVDLLASPRVLFEADFDVKGCSVLGVKLGDREEALSGWEKRENEDGWNYAHDGVSLKFREGVLYQIKMPSAFLESLGINNNDDLVQHLGNWDEMRRNPYPGRLITCGYVWNRGIVFWWQLLPKAEPIHLALFDPALGIPHDSKNVSYAIDSGVERHEEAPDTFEIPAQERRKSLKMGDLVKLMFRIQIDETCVVERMWVQVTEVGPEHYIGVLDNDPYSTDEIKSGARVQFQANDVIQIWKPEIRV